MPTSFAFSEAKIKALQAPTQGDREYHKDTVCRGLQLCVTGSGNRTYYYVRRVDGRPTRIRLGSVRQLSVDQARKAAAKQAGKIADGKNPQAEATARRHEMTVGDLLRLWESYAKSHKKSWHEDKRMCDKHIAIWETRRMSSIKKSEVVLLHSKLAETAGPYQANRVHELLRAMYNRAKEDWGYLGENPCVGIKRFREQKRDRFLHADELKAFFAALDAEPNEMLKHFFWVSLLTGARQSNVQAMRWDEIDWQAAIWRIPETKSGLPVVVPLTAAALQILGIRRQSEDSREWVFPGRRGGHLSEPKFAWTRIIKNAGLKNVRPHDLRRSLGSWMAMTQSSLPIIGKMLGHSQPTTTAIYARLAVDPVRAAAEVATTAMLEAGGKLLKSEASPDVEEGGSNGKT